MNFIYNFFFLFANSKNVLYDLISVLDRFDSFRFVNSKFKKLKWRNRRIKKKMSKKQTEELVTIANEFFVFESFQCFFVTIANWFFFLCGLKHFGFFLQFLQKWVNWKFCWFFSTDVIESVSTTFYFFFLPFYLKSRIINVNKIRKGL